jgi:hypothetical protein
MKPASVERRVSGRTGFVPAIRAVPQGRADRRKAKVLVRGAGDLQCSAATEAAVAPEFPLDPGTLAPSGRNALDSQRGRALQ